jgi:hypothetical protein
MGTLTQIKNQSPRAAEVESPDIAEFQHAMEEYRLRSGRAFPTWSEILETLRRLGYEKRMAGSRRVVPPLVRVNGEGKSGDLIGTMLRKFGGTPARGEDRPYYAFPSEDDRAKALRMVRSEFGWTSVDPL